MKKSSVVIDPNDFIRIDGVVIGKVVVVDGKKFIQVKDSMPRRIKERGEFVYYDLDDLKSAMEDML